MAAMGAILATLLLVAGLGWWWQKRLLERLQKELDQFQTALRASELNAAERACLRAAGCAKLLLIRRTQAVTIVQFSLAQVWFQQGKLEQAEQSAKTAFLKVQALRGASPITTPLVCLMAQICKKLDKDVAANSFFQGAVKLLKAQEGGQSLKVGAALHEFGVTLNRIGLPENAIPVFEESIPILEKHLGQDHKDVASALINLGKAQSGTDHFEGAELSYRRALALREASLGADDPEVAQVLNNLAVNYKRQDRFPEALECLSRALAIREVKLGPDHLDVGLVLTNLANILRLEKKYDQAEAAVSRALAILEKPPSKWLPTVLDSFGALRAAQGRYEEASQLYARCMQIHESRGTVNMIELAETGERYADVLYKLQKEKQADALLEQIGRLRSAREKLLA